MRNLLYLFLLLITFRASAHSNTFSHLAQVNRYWHTQPDVHPASLPLYAPLTPHQWIRTHLMLVEQHLRMRSTAQLTPTQRHNRTLCLNYLQQYWQTGNFPVNDHYSYQTPIFIDQYNNFCAVGYLLQASGHEHISRMIATNNNLAYVHSMHYPLLLQWAADFGFTKDELAWIQPGYPPSAKTKPLGPGVDGTVYSLAANNTTGQLFVGGAFTHYSTTIPASNIAFVTESGGTYTWHNMSTGVNGPVYAIKQALGKIFVGGSFSLAGGSPVANVAYWNDTTWHSAGCLGDTVRDFELFNDTLYAVGNFAACTPDTSSAFALWNGANWQLIPGISGHVNTITVFDNRLVLGGTITHAGVTTHSIAWSPATGFSPIATNQLPNEVMDFTIWNDKLYAACKRTHPTDSNKLLMKLEWGEWSAVYDTNHSYFIQYRSAPVSLNTLCNISFELNVGGSFCYSPLLGTSGINNLSSIEEHAVVDSAVFALTFFKGELIMGGSFKKGDTTTLNGIAKRHFSRASTTFFSTPSSIIYPNPVKAGTAISTSTIGTVISATWVNQLGQSSSHTPPNTFIAPPTPGTYTLRLIHSSGAIQSAIIQVY